MPLSVPSSRGPLERTPLPIPTATSLQLRNVAKLVESLAYHARAYKKPRFILVQLYHERLSGASNRRWGWKRGSHGS